MCIRDRANPIAYYKNENEDHGHFRIMFEDKFEAVSYTHLDVYKRQSLKKSIEMSLLMQIFV